MEINLPPELASMERQLSGSKARFVAQVGDCAERIKELTQVGAVIVAQGCWRIDGLEIPYCGWRMPTDGAVSWERFPAKLGPAGGGRSKLIVSSSKLADNRVIPADGRDLNVRVAGSDYRVVWKCR